MSQPELGRAHLLHILVHLPEAEWPAAALAAGFELRAKVQKTQPEPASCAAPAPEPVAKIPPEPAPYRPSDLPDLPFWRVAAHRLLSEEEWPTGAPSWLEKAPRWPAVPQSNPDIPPPPLQTLTPRARQARFLRRQLAIPQRGGGIDLARLCGQLAQRRIPPACPG